MVHKLGRTSDIFNINSIDTEYKEFLNIYGSINGSGFDIYGPNEYNSDSGDKIQELLSIQKGFENRCTSNKMKAEKVKSCWLIAGIDQGDEYYINLSRKKKKNIYSIRPNGESKLFAKDFLEFLEKFFEAYERKYEEEAYQEENYESDELEDFN